MGYTDLYSDTYELDQRVISIPPLETVVWNVDGSEVLVANDWVATATDRGGFDEALIRILDSNLPRGISKGMEIKALERGSGLTVWEGVIDGDPHRVDMFLEVRGRGKKYLLEENEEPRNYMAFGVPLLTDAHDAPYNFATTNDTDEIEADVKKSSLRFGVEKGETQATNAQHFLALTTPNTIQKYDFDYRKTWANGSHDISTERLTDFAGARTTIANHNLGSGGGAINTWLSISQAIGTPENSLAIGFRVNTGDTWSTKQIVRIKDFVIWGVTADPAYKCAEVVTDLATQVGLGTARVVPSPSGFALPFYSQSSWAEAMDYMCLLTDRHWGVYEDGQVEFAPYSDRNLDSGAFPGYSVSKGRGTRVDQCDPIKPFSSVVVFWTDIAGNRFPYELTVTPNPNEDTGEFAQAELEMLDPTNDSSEAADVATFHIDYLTGPRYEIDAQVTFARQDGVPISPYQIRPGRLITIEDSHEMGACVDRIRAVRYTTEGTQITCNSSVNLAERIEELAERPRKHHKRRRRRRRR